MRIINRVLDILRAMEGIDNVIYDGPASANVRLDRKNGLTALVYQLPSFEINVEASAKMESAAVQIAFLKKGRIDADGEETDAILDTIYPVLCDFIATLDEDRTIRQTKYFKVKPTYGEFDAFMVGYSVELELSDRGFSCLDTSENPVRILNVDENGTYDVTHYGKVDVNVAQPQPEWPEYMRITALETTTVDYSHYVTSAEYSINGGEWVKFQNPPYVFSLNAGDYAEFRSYDTCYDFGIVRFNFKILGKANLSGRLGSMLNPKLEGDVPTQAFGYLFRNCTGIYSVDEHFLEGLSFSYYSLEHLFDGCTNLTNVPNLPDGIRLSALSGMFKNCKSLTDGGVLPATDIEAWGYENLYYGCENLSRLTCYLDEISSPKCSHWLDGVAPTGVLRCPASTYIYEGMLPEGWTREDI